MPLLTLQDMFVYIQQKSLIIIYRMVNTFHESPFILFFVQVVDNNKWC